MASRKFSCGDVDNLYPENQAYHFFDGGYAYTEDNVLIHNIYMSRIARTLKQADLANYLSEYGELISCVIHTSTKPKMLPTGYAKFVDPLAAAKVLRKKKHTIKSKQFYVKASYSWYQPNSEKALSTVSQNNLAYFATNTITSSTHTADKQMDTDETSTQILDLNDDCLREICKKLSFHEQIMFARTCDRFLGIFQSLSKLIHKELDLQVLYRLTLWQKISFFTWCGMNIQKISGTLESMHIDRVLTYIVKYCSEVRKLHLYTTELKAHHFKKLCHPRSKIQELCLLNCYVGDFIFHYASNLPNLETFIIANNHDIQGKNLGQLKQLKRLSLSCCSMICNAYFIEGIREMKSLRCLDIRGCIHLTNTAYHTISSYCTELEALHISPVSPGYEVIAQLPKLRELAVFDRFKQTNSNILVELSKHRAEQLEILCIAAPVTIDITKTAFICDLKNLKKLSVGMKLVSDQCLKRLANLQNLEMLNLKNCTQFSDIGLVALIGGCKTLKWLNAECCYQISDDVISEIIKVLQHQPGRAPLKLLVSQNLISESTIQRAKPLVQIISAHDNEGYNDFEPFHDGLSIDLADDSDDDNDEYTDSEFDSENDYLFAGVDYDDYPDDDYYEDAVDMHYDHFPLYADFLRYKDYMFD